MISTIRRHALRFPGNAVIALFSLLALHMILHGNLSFSFLVWNTFLALLPLAFAKAAVRTQRPGLRAGFVLAWLLLFPNAAYLVTDIVHLRPTPGRAYWLDLVLLFGAGALGIALSLRSLIAVEQVFARFLPKPWLPLLTLAVLIASGYGIYLGRVERWNSWDALLRPLALLRDIFNDFRHPIRNRDAWALTALFAAMQIGSYVLFKGNPAQIKRRPGRSAPTAN